MKPTEKFTWVTLGTFALFLWLGFIGNCIESMTNNSASPYLNPPNPTEEIAIAIRTARDHIITTMLMLAALLCHILQAIITSRATIRANPINTPHQPPNPHQPRHNTAA